MAADWKDLAVSIDARLKACCAMPISNFGAAFNKEVQDDLLPRFRKNNLCTTLDCRRTRYKFFDGDSIISTLVLSCAGG